MKKVLVVVDMQKDFVNGSLGTSEAQAIVENAVKKIKSHDGPVFVTFDTHFENYLDSAEGKKLPVEHCISGTDGWKLDKSISAALEGKDVTEVEKLTFGSTELPKLIAKKCPDGIDSITLIGLCTDICVVSNALILKANYPELNIIVDSSCCAGVTPKLHESALDVMRSCQIEIL